VCHHVTAEGHILHFIPATAPVGVRTLDETYTHTLLHLLFPAKIRTTTINTAASSARICTFPKSEKFKFGA
jgi:hypothetical protein